MSLPSIVVHGGAGRVDAERLPACVAACRRAARIGLDHLRRPGGTALDAVQLAVRVLEDDAELNAGLGAVLTEAGTVELDAAIMSGADLRFGGVAAVPGLPRPIDLARAVLDEGTHILLAGEAAWEFARARGFRRDVAGELIVPRARAALAAELARRAAAPPARSEGGGTVGACAIDARGHTAVATSTGGMTGKRRGRVGDSALPGCGTYADDLAGAASATGHGERIARVTLTRFVVDRLRAGASAQEAADAGLAELVSRVDGSGGVICVDRRGHLGLAHNTQTMAWAFGLASGDVDAGAHFPITR